MLELPISVTKVYVHPIKKLHTAICTGFDPFRTAFDLRSYYFSCTFRTAGDGLVRVFTAFDLRPVCAYKNLKGARDGGPLGPLPAPPTPVPTPPRHKAQETETITLYWGPVRLTGRGARVPGGAPGGPGGMS